jgi:hypothetical protein
MNDTQSPTVTAAVARDLFHVIEFDCRLSQKWSHLCLALITEMEPSDSIELNPAQLLSLRDDLSAISASIASITCSLERLKNV